MQRKNPLKTKATGKESTGVTAASETTGAGLASRSSAIRSNRSKNTKQIEMSEEEIWEYTEIEEIQSCIAPSLRFFVQKYGKDRVISSLEWITETLKKERKDD